MAFLRLRLGSDQSTGFENMLGLELLAAVHYAMKECPDCSLDRIIASIHQWTDRKKPSKIKPHALRILDRILKL